MLVDASVLNFIHGIELSLEEDEFTGSWGILVQDVILELFKSINNLKEVSVSQEELVILDLSFLYSMFRQENLILQSKSASLS